MNRELNEQYRQDIRVLKANTRITFKYMQEYLELSKSGFYHWINGYYNMSNEMLEEVAAMIEELQ